MKCSPLERASDVAAMPHVRRWVSRWKKVMRAMPDELHGFAGAGGGAYVLALDPRGGAYTKPDGGLDQDAIVATVMGRWDGGDF